jgi:dipicolinate synthase subunit A
MSKFLFVGGDKRIIHAAMKLNKRFDCYLYGFDNMQSVTEKPDFAPGENFYPAENTGKTAGGLGQDCPNPSFGGYKSSISQLQGNNCSGVPVIRELRSGQFDNIVLPLPCSQDGENVNAPYSSEKIPLSVIQNIAGDNAAIFCGKSNPALKKICNQNNFSLIDYFEREELAVMNAVPTAEGALEIIMRESSRSIYNLNVLVTGYGRISKVLAKYLNALGANVTIAARKTSDLSWARIAGCTAININETDKILHSFNTIINTVPAPIFTREHLLKLEKDCIFVDLATYSCIFGHSEKGTSYVEGIKVIWALGLPGKAAPITAGEIIAETLFNIISEKIK